MEISDENFTPKPGRTIHRETDINAESGIIIITPDNKKCEAALLKIIEKFNKLMIKSYVLINPEPSVLKDSKTPIVVIGNLADSKCAGFLYYKLLSLVDLWYPGNGGYTARTIVNPFGTGFNIIHIGYSDETGLGSGLEYFYSNINNPLPYFSKVVYTKLPCSMKYTEKIKASAIAEDDSLIPSINASFWWYIGYIAYLTNDSEQIQKYLDGWRKVVKISQKNHSITEGAHLHMTVHMEVWRLMEHSGMLPDDLRGDIETCIFNWAQSDEGMKYAVQNCSEYLPSHNHSMLCALSLTYAADFFKTHYPKLPEPDKWEQAAEKVFYTFNNGGWKPLCDDSSYSSQISLPIVCMYSLFEDKHRFLEQSGKMAAAWIKAVMGQNGFIPSFGDGTVTSPFPGTLLGILSHYYNDGELKYIINSVNDERNMLPEISMQGTFDSGVKPVKPSNAFTVTAIPLDRYIYDCWEKDKKLAETLTPIPPCGAYEQCFDKVAIRTGPNESDDFLLIDGFGSKSNHAYSDAMGVLDYSSCGITWLVEEDCYRWPEPENCCILTIARNGFAGEIPGIALLEEKKRLDDKTAYLRMRLKNYNGTDWVREVFFVKGLCVVFRDTVEALESGEYVASSHFKTPGKAKLDGNTLKCRRKNSNGTDYELRLSGYSSAGLTMTAEEIDVGQKLFTIGGEHNNNFYNHGIKSAELGREMWVKRYNENTMVITSVTSRSSASLKKGETICLTHIVQPAAKNVSRVTAEEGNGLFRIHSGDNSFEFPAMPLQSHKSKAGEADLSCKPVRISKAADFSAGITGLYPVSNNQFACSLADGSLVLLNNGTEKWKRELKDEIHCVTYTEYGGGMLLAGCGGNRLLALNMEGEKLWEAGIKGIPTIFASWEKPYPEALCVKCGTAEGRHIIAAGCGDDHIRLYDLSGNLLNAFYVYATVPDIIEFADINADGKTEILAAGKEASSEGAFYVHDINGNPGSHIYTGRWLCNIESYSLTGGNGKFTIACGMKYDENFKIIAIEKGVQKTIASKMLGGTVNAVCRNGGSFYAGTSTGFVVSFTGSGDNRWYLDVKRPVVKLFGTGENITALCDDGQIFVISGTGKPQYAGAFPSRPSCFLQTEKGILAGCGNSIFLSGPDTMEK